jgi:hypothetical protein
MKLIIRFPTTRGVPVPIAQLVAAGLRCLNLTFDTPVCPSPSGLAGLEIELTCQTLPYISPQHRASLIASLPQIWTAGLNIIASVANA